MRWTERQRAMLGAMGITLWAPAARDGAGDTTQQPARQGPSRGANPSTMPPAHVAAAGANATTVGSPGDIATLGFEGDDVAGIVRAQYRF